MNIVRHLSVHRLFTPTVAFLAVVPTLLMVRFFIDSPSVGDSIQKAGYYHSKITSSIESDPDCFVQCLTELSESSYIMACGLYGKSRLIVLNAADPGSPSRNLVLTGSPTHFYEGCTKMDNDKLVLLTWRGKLLLEVSLKEGKVIRSTDYPRDGWGLTYDKDHHVLIATDGSSTLYRLDPGTYDVVSTCDVFISHDGVNSEKVALLNELEYFNGTIFANIYMDSFQFAESPNYILGIDPVTCFVTMVIPVFGLEPRRKGGAVFNGISTSSSGNLLVTGKNWNRIYELELGAKASDIDPLWSRYNVSQFYKQRLNFR